MDTKLKSGLILAATLIIGMALGSILTATFLKNRAFDRMADMRTQRGFVKRIERFIQPDDAQRDKVQKILQYHFQKMHELGNEMRHNFAAINDSLIKDLEPVLRPEQLKRFQKRMERMKRFGGPPGPPHKPPRRRDGYKD